MGETETSLGFFFLFWSFGRLSPQPLYSAHRERPAASQAHQRWCSKIDIKDHHGERRNKEGEVKPIVVAQTFLLGHGGCRTQSRVPKGIRLWRDEDGWTVGGGVKFNRGSLLDSRGKKGKEKEGENTNGTEGRKKQEL